MTAVKTLPSMVVDGLGSRLTSVEPIADRRGSRVWRVRLANGADLAVKAAYDNPEATGVRHGARLLGAREVAVLSAMGPLATGYLYAHGTDVGATWLAVRWIEAPTVSTKWRAARSGDSAGARREAACASATAASAVALLHTHGWRHADLQAAHILCDTSRAHLVDFALAQGPDGQPAEPVVPYRGGLVHLVAPEIAQELLGSSDDTHVTATAAAEVFSLAAMLANCWTGAWLYDYDGREPWTVPMTEILGTIAAGRRRTLAAVRPWPWPRMEDLLGAALEAPASNRPTAHELSAGLAQISNRGG